jgi:AmiR/NasT family two-component response regulator
VWYPVAFIRKIINRILFKVPASPVADVREAGEHAMTLMCVFASATDRKLLRELSMRYSWSVLFASSLDEAGEVLKKVQPEIILLDREAEPADWRNSISSLAALSNGACVLLVSRVVDEYLWNAVVSSGGYDVVRRPLSEEDLLRNVRLAWLYWSATRKLNAAATK